MHPDKWVSRFLDIANFIAQWSKDPRRKVGCVIVDDDYNQLSGGYNGFPRGVADTGDRLANRDTKNALVVHAEANAVAAAARNGHSLKGGTAYISFHPCTQCAALLIQAGIKCCVFVADTRTCTQETRDNHALAALLLREAGVEVRALCEPPS